MSTRLRRVVPRERTISGTVTTLSRLISNRGTKLSQLSHTDQAKPNNQWVRLVKDWATIVEIFPVPAILLLVIASLFTECLQLNLNTLHLRLNSIGLWKPSWSFRNSKAWNMYKLGRFTWHTIYWLMYAGWCMLVAVCWYTLISNAWNMYKLQQSRWLKA